jgi:hypothetical protein
MLGDRELVPFFAADDAAGIIAAPSSGSPEQNGQKRSRRLKKPPADAASATASAAAPPQPSLVDTQPKLAKAAKKVTSTTPPPKAGKGKKVPAAQPSSASPKQATPSKGGPAFAGGAFEKSPHPSSLPKPRFSGQSSPLQTSPVAGPINTVHATQALRTLLGVPVELPSTARQPAAPPALFSLGAAAASAPNASQQLCSMLGVRAC